MIWFQTPLTAAAPPDPQLLNVDAVVVFKKFYDMPYGKGGAFQHRSKKSLRL